jgi:pimeloyl-ACP methyl ester carboxylesterase
VSRTEIDLGDRVLAVHQGGASDGPAILYHHGSPSCGLLYDGWIADAEQRGARLIGFDRAGYGESSAMPGRRVGDVASDCAALLDHLGIERCVTWGISGGGPHALACAALLPDRVAAVASLGGPAPFDARGLNWFRAMGAENLVEFGFALAGREHVERFCAEAAEAMLGADPARLVETMAGLVSSADREVLFGPLGEFVATEIADSLAHGAAGWVDDDIAFLHPSGFAVDEIAVPALIVHGHEDRFVPVDHGIWLAGAIPGAEGWLDEDEGHLTLMSGRVGAVHEWLLAHLGSSA